MNDPIPSPYQREETFGNDNGHNGLLKDLEALVREADQYAFHDYKNKKYPMPKFALVKMLEDIISRAKNGYYDNKNVV